MTAPRVLAFSDSICEAVSCEWQLEAFPPDPALNLKQLFGSVQFP
jgi:hypothetical protein